MPTNSAASAAPASFERLQAQAADSIRRDARRVHELAERFRDQYRSRLNEWMELRGRLDRRGSALRLLGSDVLRSEYDQASRELAGIQAQLKRLDAVARQLDVLHSYLSSAQQYADEPSLGEADASPAAMSLRIVQAQEGERQRLAEEVHDGPAQVLTNAIFQVEYLDRVIGREPGTRAELAYLRDMLRNGLDEVRSFIADLRPPVVDVGLGAALADQGAALEARHGIAVRVEVEGIDAGMTPAAKASVLRIVQEALQNVRKHAAATEVRIGLEQGVLVIGDNGRGFDVMRLASGASRNFGLQFMRERAELMGGELRIESRQGEGTRILLRLPERSEEVQR